MYTTKTLKGNNLTLRQLEFSDCTNQYVNWLNNPEINKYLESRWQHQTIQTIKDFLRSIQNNTTSYIFAICFDEKHIGNIKINISSARYKIADVGYFIGDKSYWGRGIATEAVRLVTDFGFKELGLYKIFAGVIEGNIGSQKVLEKLGYKQEATFRKHCFLNDESDRRDVYEYAILSSEWQF